MYLAVPDQLFPVHRTDESYFLPDLEASAEIDGLHFWSWGYGYLYTVKTSLWVDGRKVDEVATRTGFRKLVSAEE